MQMETLWKLFPGGSNGRVFFQPAWRRSPGEEKWIPTPVLPREFHGKRSLAGYTVHGVAKNQTRLSNFH